MSFSQDKKIQHLCMKMIERHSMDAAEWQHTALGTPLRSHPPLDDDELPVVSIYFSEMSWCVLTTRRVLGVYFTHKVDIESSEISETNFGNFKGYGGKSVEVMTMRKQGGEEIRLEYETGKASMAPIYYFLFWTRKYPIIDKLVY